MKFFAHGNSYGLYLTADAAVLALCPAAQSETGRHAEPPPDRSRLSTTCQATRMRLEGASVTATPAGEEKLPGMVNYFIGNDPAKWRTQIPIYARVHYRDIYRGIDLVYYGDHQQLEYDFILAPGADVKNIRLRFDGALHLQRAANGDLLADMPEGTLTLRRPAIYQIEDGRRIPVSGEFALSPRHTVRFRLGRYDRTKPLVIDPVLVYSTFLGGNGSDTAYAIAVDASGEAYIAGSTASTTFPVTPGAFQPQDNGGTQTTNGFISKLNATGTALVYSTYLGGSGNNYGAWDGIRAIAIDSSGDAYVTGTAGSTDFPITRGAFQAMNKAAANQCVTAFVAELNATGTALIYSSYLGGSGIASSAPYGGDEGYGIAVDSAGEAYLTGQTYSSDFPVTSGAFQTVNHAAAGKQANAFITKVNATGTALVYSTFLGGSTSDSASALAIDASGNAYAAGSTSSTNFPVTPGAFQTTQNAAADGGVNAFVSKLNPTGTALVYSTYLGGSTGDSASALAIDGSGNAYVAGSASSTNFPVTAGAFQTTNKYGFGTPGGPSSTTGPNAFIAKFNPAGSALVYSTYLGGSGGIVNLSPTLSMTGGDQVTGIAIDSSGDAYVAGKTASPNFPVTPGAFQTVNNDQTADSIGGFDGFVTELNPSGTALVYSTYLGGNGLDPADFIGAIMFGSGDQAYALALDSANNVYVTGSASSENFPVTNGAFQLMMQSKQNAFVTKLALSAGPTTAIPATVTVIQSPTPATSAQAITVTVTASGPSSSPTPTGTITMSTGGYGPEQLGLSGGSATFDIPVGTLPAYSCYNEIFPYTIPANPVAANYIPDAASSSQYIFSSATGQVLVGGPCFNFVVAAAITPAQAAQPLSVGVVATTYTGMPLPTGTLTLSVGNYTSSPAQLAGGNASFTLPAGTLATGFNTLSLSYSGDSNYLAMPQAGSQLVIVGSVTVTVTPEMSTVAQNVALPVDISVAVTTGAPHSNAYGDVTLTSTGYTSPSTYMTTRTTIIIPVGTLPVGTNPLTASYSNGDYPPASGSSSVIVTSAVAGGFTITGTPVGLEPGATSGNTSSITVTPTGGFTGSVSLAAAITSEPVGAIDLPTLSFGSTTPANIAGTGAGTATLTITTSGGGGCTSSNEGRRENPWIIPGGASLAAILLLAVPRRRRWGAWLALALLAVCLAGGVSACSSSSTSTPCNESSTTAGTYTITVTGTSGSATATGTVTLTVE